MGKRHTVFVIGKNEIKSYKAALKRGGFIITKIKRMKVITSKNRKAHAAEISSRLKRHVKRTA